MIRTQQDIANRIQRYDDMLYDSRPVKFTDFISNKYNIVHRKIYLYALNKYIKSYINEMISSEFLFVFVHNLRLAFWPDCNTLKGFSYVS